MRKRVQKLYVYVDETGQDTKGELFLVSVVLTDTERERLRKKLILFFILNTVTLTLTLI